MVLYVTLPEGRRDGVRERSLRPKGLHFDDRDSPRHLRPGRVSLLTVAHTVPNAVSLRENDMEIKITEIITSP